MKLFVAVPSYKGISDDEARAELVTAFRQTDADAILMQDDDVKVEAASIKDMALCGEEVVSAPCRMRSADHLFNVTPIEDPTDRNGVTLARTLWTGLGCVLVRRKTIEALCEYYSSLHYRSEVVPGKRSVALFNALLVPCGHLEDGASMLERDFCGDDRAFSIRLREMHVPIWASINARTNHRGLEGCLGEEARKQ